MNQLPEARRAVYGRTFSTRWNPASYDPIERPRAGLSLADTVGAVLVAAVVAAVLLHGMDALFI